MDASANSKIQLRPGERMLAGKPYVFDGGLLGQHLAREAVLNAPRRLSGLSFEALTALSYRAHQVSRHPTVTEDLMVIPWSVELVDRADAVIAAWCAMPEHRAAYGAPVSAQVRAA